ncbi:hypothetical protein MBLNU457_4664t3 [Dothideomycetes sp. NU457]
MPSQNQRQPQSFMSQSSLKLHPVHEQITRFDRGSYDDPVVSFVSKQLLSHGFVVGTFNFRGAPGSRGRTSWTGKPERADYISFVGFMTSYLRALTQSDTKIEDDSAAAAQESVQLVLGGYSYGSLIVTHLPPLDDMLLSFQDPAADTAASDIVQKSRYIAGETIPRNRRGVNPKSNGDGDEPAPATVGLNMHDFMVRYLLISPLLPPVSFFLNPSFGSLDVGGLRIGRCVHLSEQNADLGEEDADCLAWSFRMA